MSIGLLFWVLMILSLLFWGWSCLPGPASAGFRSVGNGLLIFVLLALLGWKVFGPALHG